LEASDTFIPPSIISLNISMFLAAEYEVHFDILGISKFTGVNLLNLLFSEP
jgi:hypothetical protein